MFVRGNAASGLTLFVGGALMLATRGSFSRLGTREAVLAAIIPERPGSFKTFCRLLGARNITEFNYRYAHPDEAVVFVGVQVQSREECAALIATLQAHGVRAFDFSANEMAKLHIRHMVGGHAPHADHEILYRCEFPERPGALLDF